MPEAGHNNPPSMIETATETMRDISAWMAEAPVIETEESAREAKLYLDRGKLGLKDLDDERDSKVRPLNERVKEINAQYKPIKEDLSVVVGLLGVRIAQFIAAERAKREEIAAEAARRAAEAEQRARDAEQAECESITSADSGELGVDVAASTQAANQAFRVFEKLAHQAAIADRETHVKIGGGFSRAVSLRQKETLVVTDVVIAVEDLGHTKDIDEAIIKSARAYRKLHNKLPNGVESHIREEI